MQCPACGAIGKDRVVDSRLTDGGKVIRRRRHCGGCARRFTTKERVEEDNRLTVVKKDGTRMPFDPRRPEGDVLMTIRDGVAVFTQAVDIMTRTSRKALDDAGRTVDDVTYWIPHQANSRIIAAAQKQLGVPDRATLSTVALFGNSSAATIPFSLSYATQERSIEPGDIVLMAAAGAGLTGGSLVLRW